MIRPGGILIIDHRNYDFILDSGRAPSKNIYYNVSYKRTHLITFGCSVTLRIVKTWKESIQAA